MKRTKTQVIGASFLEFNEFSNNIYNVYTVGDLLYGIGRNHIIMPDNEFTELKGLPPKNNYLCGFLQTLYF